jgi:hypothetical protein
MLEHGVDPHAPVAVVVVVALPERAEGVDRHLVVVAEVVAEHFEVAAVGPAAEDHPLPVGLARIVDDVAEAIHDGLAIAVVDGPARVTEVEVPAAVGADHEGVHRVIVLRHTGLREQDLAVVSHEIPVVVVKHEHLGGARHDHLPPLALADHADAERTIDVAALVKHRLLVGHAVAGGVFEHQDPVPRRPSVALAAVVGHLADPDSSCRVDVDVGGAREQRIGGEQADCQVVGQGEGGRGIGGAHRSGCHRCHPAYRGAGDEPCQEVLAGHRSRAKRSRKCHAARSSKDNHELTSDVFYHRACEWPQPGRPSR